MATPNSSTTKSKLPSIESSFTQEQKALLVIESALEQRAVMRDLAAAPTSQDEFEDYIYRLAHSANTIHGCYDAHDDWRGELLEAFKAEGLDKK